MRNAPGSNRPRRVYTCPVELTLDVIGGKWKPIILWELHTGGRHFNQLQSALGRVSHKVLTAQLRALERDGLITRTAAAGSTTIAVYALSAFGATLEPVLQSLAGWAKSHPVVSGRTLAAREVRHGARSAGER